MNAAINSAAAEQPSVRLTDAQLRELMRLVKGANSVELKLTVPATAHRATIQGLPMDPVEAQPRQVYFFDTPDLKLFNAGVVVRARRRAGGAGDTVVKLRPVEPDDIPQDLKNDASFNIEVDALPGGFVCSASYKGRSTGQLIRDAVSGKKRLSRIFSKGQRAYYKAHAPAGIDMDSLVPLGPTFLLKGRFDSHMGIDGKTIRSMVAEVWLYPDGSRILELSTKCLPKDALAVASEARAYLVANHVPTNAAQETKTRTALEFYSKALAAEIAEEKAAARRTPAKRAATRPGAKPAAGKRAPAKAAPKPAAAKPAAAKPRTAAAAAPKTTANPAAKPAVAKPSATTRRAATTRRPSSSRTSPAARSTRRTPTARRKTSSSGS
jgi:pyruvate/2-oxoglutarate dehydrogenase complex dihydrolipoamide acyltransferase (E2) component